MFGFGYKKKYLQVQKELEKELEESRALLLDERIEVHRVQELYFDATKSCKEMQKEITKYKDLYCDEVEKRLALAERVVELEKVTSADAVPKSEIVRDIEEFEKRVGQIYNRYVFEDTDYTEDDVAVEAVMNALTDVSHDLAELKKKYVEDTHASS